MIGRRSVFIGGFAAIGLPRISLADTTKFPVPAILHPNLTGTHLPTQGEVAEANMIFNTLPSDSYVGVMQALADIKQINADKEPYNRRWTVRANPLLVRIWNEMGIKYSNDCVSFCGITLGWCMKRTGFAYPRHCESSQAWLNFKEYGKQVTTPQSGDICVFTDIQPQDKGQGHVTVFEGRSGPSRIIGLGANQRLAIATNCGKGYDANVVDKRAMPLNDSYWKFAMFVRPHRA